MKSVRCCSQCTHFYRTQSSLLLLRAAFPLANSISRILQFLTTGMSVDPMLAHRSGAVFAFSSNEYAEMKSVTKLGVMMTELVAMRLRRTPGGN